MTLNGGALTLLSQGDEAVFYQAGGFVPATNGGKFPGRSRQYSALISGGSAGAHTVSGITVDDDLDEVLHFTSGALTSLLTDEFSISDADEINNTSGTDTTGDQLLVRYTRRGNFDLTGLTFPDGETTKAAMLLSAPASWPSVDINVIGIAESFGSGDVVFYESGSTGTATITVAAFYGGVLDFDTAPTWTTQGSSSPLAGFQTCQLALSRLGASTDPADTLAEGFAVLCVVLTNGG